MIKLIPIKNRIVKLGSILAFMGIFLGAFGAHWLKPFIQSSIWDKGIQYWFYHVFAIFIVNTLVENANEKLLQMALKFFVMGIFCFSGSLFWLSVTVPAYKAPLLVGPITPLGGLLLMAGWITIFLSVYNKSKEKA